MIGRLFLVLFLILSGGSLPGFAQEGEKRRIEEKYGASVVSIRNEEGYGSGLVLDDHGTILTNAHVIVSPLPFRVRVDLRNENATQSCVFQKVKLIGVHPTQDLALIRIDLSEHPGRPRPLPISKAAARAGDLVHAVGYPSTHGGSLRIVTTGEVTGVNRFVDMPGYFEYSAETHPGNSGGPILTPQGEAVGLVTWGVENGERIAFAIPLHELRPDKFVPLDHRAKNPANAAKHLRLAELLLKKTDKGGLFAALLAGEFFSMALSDDISNADTYYKIGMIKRNAGLQQPAAAYLVRSVQLEPWGPDRGMPYSELGIALHLLGKVPEAMAVWNEGVAKYPFEAGPCWDAVAIYRFNAAEFLAAACATRASIRSNAPRANVMNEMYQQCRKRLSGDDLVRLAAYEQGIGEQQQQTQKLADAARRDAKRFVTGEGAAVINAFQGVQGEAANFDFSSLGKGPSAAPPKPLPDDERVSLFVVGRINVAREFIKMEKLDKAAEILEDLIQQYPQHPEIESARIYLSLLRKRPK